uniref:Uncharacterized protein n=1 Tax=Minutocellus polymorphus TaxID=265543 RepID=A0A7S0FJ34_9STRA|mmetsp:Transcript_12558/g.20905  ORF Transcript_12558/g.20905 Transcript_12558/m.20905 type:complete len:322 (+) Transcript_12558:83-1048(+)
MSRSDLDVISVDEDKRQQKLLVMSPSIQSSQSSMADCKNSVPVLVTPAERLEQELHQVRKFLEDAHLGEDASVEQAKNEGDDSIGRHLESAHNLKDEMDKAKHELMQSSLRAEEYLADLSELGDEGSEKDDLMRESRVVAKTSRHPQHQEGDTTCSTSTATMDMKVLLAGMADLKRELSDARIEISKLRQEVSGIDGAQTDQIANKTHRRVHSYPTTHTTANTTSIPTVVECIVDGSSSSHTTPYMVHESFKTREDFDDIVHRAYVANHMRISDGFVENSWLDSDNNDGENDCGGDTCFLGGLVNVLKGSLEGNAKKDVFG